MARLPIVSALVVRVPTCARNSSPRPCCAAIVNGCSSWPISHSPALSASNSERVSSTTSPSTELRSRVPVSSLVTDRRARARRTSRRARPRSRELARAVATLDVIARMNGGDMRSAEAASMIRAPTRPERAMRRSTRFGPSLAIGSSPIGELDGGGGSKPACATSSSEPSVAMYTAARSACHSVRRASTSARATPPGDGVVAMPVASRSKIASSSARTGRSPSAGSSIGRGILDEDPLDLAPSEAPIATRIDPIRGQAAGIGPAANRVGVDAEERRGLCHAEERVLCISRHRRFAICRCYRAPLVRMELLVGPVHRMLETGGARRDASFVPVDPVLRAWIRSAARSERRRCRRSPAAPRRAPPR